MGSVRLNGSNIYHKNGNPIYLKEGIVKLKRDNHLKFILIQACHLTFSLIKHALWHEAWSSHPMWIELALQNEPIGFSTAWKPTVSYDAWVHGTVQHMDADMWLMGAWLTFDDQMFPLPGNMELSSKFCMQIISKSESLEVFWTIL